MSEPSTKRRKTNDGGARITDPRFANIQSDPRYRLPGKKTKVKLDKRFANKFKDADFTRRAKVDRYGRPIQSGAEARRLRDKFEFEEEDVSDVPDDDDEVQEELVRMDNKHDPLREGKLDASSSEDGTSSEEEPESDGEEIVDEAELAESKEDVPAGDVSTRIAIVNLDWDNIRAEDLMAVFQSFLPATGRLLKVAVYPSEFGRERMEREEMEGPPKEIFAALKEQRDEIEDRSEDEETEEDDEDIKAAIIKPDDGTDFDSQALRQYQLERLRYFYAVLTFSSKQTAKAIYDAVDGTEYLSTANFFDLRFIPEEMDFSDDKSRDECEQLASGYKPNEFVTDALQHSKVRLTWDQEDRTRKEAQARAFRGGQKEIDENDLKAYLGSDTEEDDEEEQTAQEVAPVKSKKELEREKARALLGLPTEPVKKGTKKDKDTPSGNIQVTFSSGLSGANDGGQKRSVFENSPEPQETTVEKYVRKEKERKQKRKDKMKTGKTDEDDTKAAIEDVEPDTVQAEDGDMGFDDPFFDESAMNDPTIKNKMRKEERAKKRREREAEEAASAKQRADLELLMAEDDKDTAEAVNGKGRTVRHFDMTEIEKAERRTGKKDKFRKKRKKDEDERVVAQDDFNMDTTDPRFGKLFEYHEFAIDPTNQKLRQTKGMQKLMEESRRRKQNGPLTKEDVEDDDVQEKKEKQKKKSQDTNQVRDLVAKLKRKG